MKKLSLFAFSSVVVFAFWAVVFVNSHVYAVNEAVENIGVLYSKNEIFVFIPHVKGVMNISRIKMFACGTTQSLLYSENIKDVNENLMVAHFKDDHVFINDLVDFGIGGDAYFYQNKIYWIRGRLRGEIWPYVWVWDGSNFLTLSKDDSTVIHQEIARNNTTNENAGWSKAYFTTGSTVPSVICNLDAKSFMVESKTSFKKISNKNYVNIILKDRSGKVPPKILIQLPEGYQRISRDEYNRLIANKEINSTRQP